MRKAPFDSLLGLTLSAIRGHEIGSETITFETTEGRRFQMHYYDDCCATCTLNDVAGDFADLIGNPILQAEEVSSSNEGEKPGEYSDSWTWTFYKLSTVKGSVTLRWLGESNGYYSESVTFEELTG
jgi:hypothetical protein